MSLGLYFYDHENPLQQEVPFATEDYFLSILQKIINDLNLKLLNFYIQTSTNILDDDLKDICNECEKLRDYFLEYSSELSSQMQERLERITGILLKKIESKDIGNIYFA